MGEIKPGILAMVVGYTNVPDNVGKIVTVKEFARKGHRSSERTHYVGSGDWFCVGDELTAWSTITGPVKTGYAYIAENHLMPINPKADPLEQTQKQEQSA